MSNDIEKQFKSIETRYKNIHKIFSNPQFELIADLEDCRNHVRNALGELKCHQPSKIFKDDYKKWKNICQKLKILLDKIDDDLMEQYIYLENTFHTN